MAGYIGTKASVVTPGAERKLVFPITTTTTSLTGLAYTPGFVHVFHNGIRLVDGTDYTATTGTSITLTTAAENGDEVVVVSLGTFQVADAYTKAEADNRYVNVTGDTMTGNLTTSGALQSATFSDGTVSVGSTYLTNGSAKVWVNFNGTGTIATRDSFNLSSLTDNSTGRYILNFTNSFAAANYSAPSTATNGTEIGVDDQRRFISSPSIEFQTTNLEVGTVNAADSAFADTSVVVVSINGDLA